MGEQDIYIFLTPEYLELFFISSPILDPWLSFASLSNCLARINTASIKFYDADEISSSESSGEAEFYWLCAPEETELRGFLPLMNLASDEVFVKSTVASVCSVIHVFTMYFTIFICNVSINPFASRRRAEKLPFVGSNQNKTIKIKQFYFYF